jgi:class 3 adenylate cyclase
MPLYMDRHEAEGVTPEALAQAHEKDLACQGKHGVNYKHYWHDQNRGCIFCLVEAPSKDAAIEVHREAHGLLANEIIEVDPNTVKAFFGDIEAAPSLMTIAPLKRGEEDTAFRAILFTDLQGSTTLTSQLGDAKAMELLRTHNAMVREKLKGHSGREVKHTGDGFMACFGSVSQAVECAIGILGSFDSHNQENPDRALRLRIGLSAGEPVAEDADLFGATVQLAARLCAYAQPEQIIVASVVQELCLGKKLQFKSHGKRKLKGFDHGVNVYEVEWRSAQKTSDNQGNVI